MCSCTPLTMGSVICPQKVTPPPPWPVQQEASTAYANCASGKKGYRKQAVYLPAQGEAPKAETRTA